MKTFNNLTKGGKALSVISFLTGAVGLILFLLTLKIISQQGQGFPLVVLLLMFGLTILGMATGVGIWKRYQWALNGVLVYYAVQILAIQTPVFFFHLYSGFHLFVHISLGSIMVAINLFTLGMFIWAIQIKRVIGSANV